MKVKIWVYPIVDTSDAIGGYLVRGPFYTAREARADQGLIMKDEWCIGKLVRVDLTLPEVAP